MVTPPRSAPTHHHWKLLTPERRRRALVALVDRFGVSERRACRVTGQWRSTQRLACRARARFSTMHHSY